MISDSKININVYLVNKKLSMSAANFILDKNYTGIHVYLTQPSEMYEGLKL